MTYTIKDVAIEAGVSVTTVSRVINNRGYIADTTKAKVFAAMKKLNYYPNSVARSLSGKRMNLIGVIVPHTNTPFFAELVEELESQLFSKGYKIILCNSFNMQEKELAYLKMLQENQVDGIISSSHNENTEAYRQINLPIVSFDRYLGSKIATVSSDNFYGGQLAARAYIESKAKRILYVSTNVEESAPTHDRLQGFLSELKKAKVKNYQVTDIPFNMSKNRRKMLLHSVMEEFQPGAIATTDDITALHIKKELELWGKRTPDDCQLIGYDGSQFISELFPELSTVIQPIADIANLLIELLLDRILDQHHYEIKQYVLPVTYHRGTTTYR